MRSVAKRGWKKMGLAWFRIGNQNALRVKEEEEEEEGEGNWRRSCGIYRVILMVFNCNSLGWKGL